MPIIKELDERMTINLQSWKKKKLKEIAKTGRLSESKLLLKIVDEWLERYSFDDKYHETRQDDGG